RVRAPPATSLATAAGAGHRPGAQTPPAPARRYCAPRPQARLPPRTAGGNLPCVLLPPAPSRGLAAPPALFRAWEEPVDPRPGVTTVTDHTGTEHVVVSSHALVRRVLVEPDLFRPDNARDAVTPTTVQALRIVVRPGVRVPPTPTHNGTPSHRGVPPLRDAA